MTQQRTVQMALDAVERAALAVWRDMGGRERARVLEESRAFAPSTRLDPVENRRSLRLTWEERVALAEWRRRRDDVREQNMNDAVALYRFENYGRPLPTAATHLTQTLKPACPSIFRQSWSRPRRIQVHTVGTLLGGAVGNAYGVARSRGIPSVSGSDVTSTTHALRLSCLLTEALTRAHVALRRMATDTVRTELERAHASWRREAPEHAQPRTWMAYAMCSLWWAGFEEDRRAPDASELLDQLVLDMAGPEAGAPAAALARIVRTAMTEGSIGPIRSWPAGGASADALVRARELSWSRQSGRHQESLAELAGFGDAAAALAIGAYAALACESWREALDIATAWDGDVVASATACGFVKGALEGPGRIDRSWLDSVDIADDVYQLGLDAAQEFGPTPRNDVDWFTRYPVPTCPPKPQVTAAAGASVTPTRVRWEGNLEL